MAYSENYYHTPGFIFIEICWSNKNDCSLAFVVTVRRRKNKEQTYMSSDLL